MSPKANRFKSDSFIYFLGDGADKIYILKSGKILLKSNDIETNEELKELINTGEFFGVKSALGKSPRDETAVVLQDSDVISFTVPEFEQMVLANTRVIMKMLKVFSNQLRRIHSKVQSLMTKTESTDQEQGLFSVGDYYFNTRQYKQAAYALSRYLTYYPSGRLATQANLRLEEAERLLASGGSGGGTSLGPHSHAGSSSVSQGPIPPGKEYYTAVSLINQDKYSEAYQILQKIVSGNSGGENQAKAEFELGHCLVMMNKFDEAIRYFTAFLQKYPKHPDLKDALYYIGKSYEGKKDLTYAKNFFEKILAMADEDEPVAVKTRKALKALGSSQ